MLRRATANDHQALTRLAADAFAELGDYGSMLSSWLIQPGVDAYLEEEGTAAEGARLVGFFLLGYLEPPALRAEPLLVDLLALAVAPGHRGQGHGRRLLREAIHRASLTESGGAEMRLTVSESNAAGRGLFSSAGFEILDPNHGAYPQGQRAIRMRLSLPPSGPPRAPQTLA